MKENEKELYIKKCMEKGISREDASIAYEVLKELDEKFKENK